MSALHPESQYYLHTNGDVIYKPHGGVDETSDFVKAVWNASVIGETPMDYLKWLMRLADLGARREKVRELWKRQNLTSFVGEEVEREFMEKLDA